MNSFVFRVKMLVRVYNSKVVNSFFKAQSKSYSLRTGREHISRLERQMAHEKFYTTWIKEAFLQFVILFLESAEQGAIF